MKIALIGYGKMGQAIERIAQQRGHEVVLRISTANRADMTPGNLRNAEVAIEFSVPHVARQNVLECLESGLAVVSGTTGWNEHLQEAKDKAVLHDTAFLHASNFSIGVNIFFEVNKLLARLMAGRSDYDVKVEETHHIHKKDAPAGTAITLAEQIIAQRGGHTAWTLNAADGADTIPIFSHRIGDVPGTHHVSYSSEIDTIDISHTAHNRNGFALGAVLAAEFLAGKKGVYSMTDVLGL